MLMAPTSPAVPINHESLTYLNQDQCYEVRCKLNSNSAQPCHITFTSLLRISFHDRRQINNEKSLWNDWRKLHPGQKLLTVDRSLSENVLDIREDIFGSFVRFEWKNGCKKAKLSIKVNCMSTEFTTKKHGGEKGVPFRLTVETFQSNPDGFQKLPVHSAYTQIRVFTAKGADRKNRTDRLKAERRVDKERFQPAYDYTMFTEAYPSDFADEASNNMVTNSADALAFSSTAGTSRLVQNRDESSPSAEGSSRDATVDTTDYDAGKNTMQWMKERRFSHCAELFCNYSMDELMVLSKNELVEIVGAGDGIRLHNYLHPRPARPSLTLLIRKDSKNPFTAVYLAAQSMDELRVRIGNFLAVGLESLSDPLLWEVRPGVKVAVTDEVVKHWNDLANFTIRTEESEENVVVILQSDFTEAPV